MRDLLRLRGGMDKDYEQAIVWGDGIVRAVLDYLQGAGQESAKYALDFLQIMATHACPYAKWLSLSGNLSDTVSLEILRWAIMFLRDMIVLRSGAKAAYIRLTLYKDEMINLLPYWTDQGLMTNIAVMETGLEAMKRHVNTRLVWDYVSLQCIQAKGGD